MKNARKLIPAIAMLLVATVMMSTASFAWFSMNRDVTATGMSVTAKANAQFLLIGTADNATDKSASGDTKTATNASATVYPAGFTATGTAVGGYTAPANSWYTANNANSDSPNDAVISGKAVTEGAADYMLTNNFWLTLSNDSEAYNSPLKITFNLASGDAAISAVVKIGTAYYMLDSTNSTVTTANVTLSNSSSLQVVVYTYINGDSAHVYSDYGSEITGNMGLTFELV